MASEQSHAFSGLLVGGRNYNTCGDNSVWPQAVVIMGNATRVCLVCLRFMRPNMTGVNSTTCADAAEQTEASDRFALAGFLFMW